MLKSPPLLTYEAGDVVFREGENPADGLYLITQGRVKISLGDKTLAEMGKNEFFGEMALIDKKPRSATVTAIEKTQCLRISPIEFQTRLKSLDPMMQGIVRILIERLRDANKR